MLHYVYIIKSFKDDSFYKGYSEDPVKRILQHNAGESPYTSAKTPWCLVYVEEFEFKRDALIREKNLKKATRDRICALLTHPKNIVAQFG